MLLIGRIFQCLPATALDGCFCTRVKGNVAFSKPSKDGLQRVIIFLTDRVEFVLMAPRTVGGCADECRHCLRDHVVAIQILKSIDRRGCCAVVVCSCANKTERRNQLGVVRKEHISGQLFSNEAIPRLVAVETFDQIIAKSPCVRPQRIVFESMRVGKMNRVHPVPRPAFAITRRFQQSVDQLLISIRRGIVHERNRFLDRRMHPVQVHHQSPNQSCTISFGRQTQAVLVLLGDQKPINRM